MPLEGIDTGGCHQLRKEQSWEVGVMMTRALVASGEMEVELLLSGRAVGHQLP